MRHIIIRASVAVGLAVAAAQAGTLTATAAGDTESGAAAGQYATFEGDTIDLSLERGDAVACAITDSGNRCYRSEAEMDRSEARLANTGYQQSRSANCSSSVRLYTGSGHTGNITAISTRSQWISLSTLGIDNTTSSYKIGACSAAFRSGAFGTGNSYPGSTSAYAQSTSMVSGWDNVVSSVRLS